MGWSVIARLPCRSATACVSDPALPPSQYRGSLAAFLFTWPEGDTSVNPTKLQKVGGAGLAQVDDGTGPKFGMMDLACPLAGANPKRCMSKLGSYYERMPNESNSMIQVRRTRTCP